MQEIHKKYKAWKYKNITLLILSLVLFFYISDTNFVQNVFRGISELGIIGLFLTGVFFVSTFTVVPASYILVTFANSYDPFLISLIAGFGAVVGDYIIFRFFRDGVLLELKPIFYKLGGSEFSKLIKTPYFAWLAPVIGALIIASPLPDEIGIGLMGISKLKNWQFIAISFLLNSIGIFFIIEIIRFI